MACEQPSHEPIPLHRLTNSEVPASPTQDNQRAGIPATAVNGCSWTETPSDTAENLAVRRYLFVKPPDSGQGPYFEAFSAVAGFWDTTFKKPPESSDLPLEKCIVVHKDRGLGANATGAEVDPVEDIWSLEKSEKSDLFIFVEDLDPKIIETIGSNLEKRPPIFEKHLRDSCYLRGWPGPPSQKQGDLHFPDLGNSTNESNICTTSAPFASLCWFSVASLLPILERHLGRGQKLPAWQELHRSKHIQWTANGSARALATVNNIFRQQRLLSCKSGSPGSKSWYACKEQVTISISMRGANRDGMKETLLAFRSRTLADDDSSLDFYGPVAKTETWSLETSRTLSIRGRF